MNSKSQSDRGIATAQILPRVLIVDDQFGRCGLGREFRRHVGEGVWAGYCADRRNLCERFGLLDGTGVVRTPKSTDILAEAMFCPGQTWSPREALLENAYEPVQASVSRGWPFPDGRRWAMVLVDLRFASGTLDAFGDPQSGSMFGLEEILPRLRKDFGPDLPVLVLSSTARDTHNAAIRRLGALDFVQRVPGPGAPADESRKDLASVLDVHGLLEDGAGMVVGRSMPVLKMLRQARRGAKSARNLLLVGETGTGKGLLARYIHAVSGRSAFPFETFQGAHRPAELQADELFGHWKGAFTGAHGDSAGVWERANGGTLFIDEVGDIHASVQQALMEPIEERRVRRLGSPPRGARNSVDVDELVILATNKELEGENSGLKRDFLNRINAYTIRLPALRERLEDIPLLLESLRSSVAPLWTGRVLPDAIELLQRHDWVEGNIRELRNCIERAVADNPGQDVTALDISIHASATSTHAPLRSANNSLGRRLAAELAKPSTSLSLSEAQHARVDLKGGLAELVVDALELALRVTASPSGPNPTAAAAFLLGRPDLTTVQAKQFIRRLLTLDASDGQIVAAFESTGLPGQHRTLRRLVDEASKRRGRSHREGVSSVPSKRLEARTNRTSKA